jgi:hypothetical protein
MAKHRNKIILYCLLLIGVSYLGITTWISIRRINQSNREQLPSSDSLSTEYICLITKKDQSKIKVDQVYQSKVRHPLAKLYFEDSSILFITKIGTIKDVPLSKIAHSEINNRDETKEKVYNILTNGSYQFEYESKNVDSISGIYLTCSNDSLTTIISNDSILSYHLLCKNSSVSYSEKGAVDMILEGTQQPFGKTSVSADILFIKRNNVLYVLLMIAKPNTLIEPKALYDIVHS